jgi:hypothetical protein
MPGVRKGRNVARRDAETQRLSRRLYGEITRRGDPEQDWWVSRGVVEWELGMNPDGLFDAAELLVKEGRAESNTSDLMLLRPIRRDRSL